VGGGMDGSSGEGSGVMLCSSLPVTTIPSPYQLATEFHGLLLQTLSNLIGGLVCGMPYMWLRSLPQLAQLACIMATNNPTTVNIQGLEHIFSLPHIVRACLVPYLEDNDISALREINFPDHPFSTSSIRPSVAAVTTTSTAYWDWIQLHLTKSPVSINLLFYAARLRDLHLLTHLKEQGHRPRALPTGELSLGHLGTIRYRKFEEKDICAQAAKAGHLEILQWARANGCPWNEETCAGAARCGHLEVLQWARANGCPWDEDTYADAAFGGHLEVLQWARANGCPWDKETCAGAASGGHLEVLQWARANGCPWDKETCAGAASGGHLEVLQWARANGCPWDKSTCSRAALWGNFEILQWTRVNGCPWDEGTCASAAYRGNLEVLQWARANGCLWDEETCADAALGGHLEVLQWARANGCPWDKKTCTMAARSDNLEILQWARANGCPWDKQACEQASKYEHGRVTEWLETQFNPIFE
jgi:hypothetical protein